MRFNCTLPRASLLLLTMVNSLLPQTSVTPVPPISASSDQRDVVYYPGDTERITLLSRKLVTNIWLDQKGIWISPFRMKRKDSITWAGFGALTVAAVLTDRRTTHIFENSMGQIRWGNNVSHVGAIYTVLPEVAGFYLAGVVADSQKARETGILGGEALLDGLLVVEGLKLAAGRNRPNAVSKPGDFFQGGASFPSGHSIESWALASVIAREYANRKWVPWVAYGLAATVGSARFAARQHYASDILAGSAMGFFIGRFVVHTHEVHAGHHHASLSPVIQFATNTYGVSVDLSR